MGVAFLGLYSRESVGYVIRRVVLVVAVSAARAVAWVGSAAVGIVR